MPRIGAQTGDLAALKGVFDAQAALLEDLRRTVDSRLRAVYWEGPARERFEEHWSEAQPILKNLQQGLDAAGREAQRVAREIQHAGR